MAFNIGDFSAQINKYGLARDNLFLIRLNAPFIGGTIGASDLQFFCRSVSIPSLAVSTADVINRGYGQNEKRPIAMPFENLSSVFMVDSTFQVKQFFDLWIQRVYNYDNSQGYDVELQQTRALPFEVGYRDEYAGTMEVIMYSMTKEEITYVYKFEGLYPVSLGDITVAWENNDSILTLPITFAYDTFKLDKGQKLIRASDRYHGRSGTEYIFALGNFGAALSSLGINNNLQRVVNDFTTVSASISRADHILSGVLSGTAF